MQASRRASQKKKERNSDRISVEEKNVYAEEKKHFFFLRKISKLEVHILCEILDISFIRNIKYYLGILEI